MNNLISLYLDISTAGKVGVIFSAKDPLHLLSQGDDSNYVTDVVGKSFGQDCNDDDGMFYIYFHWLGYGNIHVT